MRVINRVEGTCHVAVGGALNTQFREQHWSAAFGSIDQHLNCQPPFGRFTLGFGELPYKVRRIAERSRWRTARQRYRLIEGALPRHERTPRKTFKPRKSDSFLTASNWNQSGWISVDSVLPAGSRPTGGKPGLAAPLCQKRWGRFLRGRLINHLVFERHAFRIVCLKSLVRGKSE